MAGGAALQRSATRYISAMPGLNPISVPFITELQGILSTLSIASTASVYFMASTKADLVYGIHVKGTDISSFL